MGGKVPIVRTHSVHAAVHSDWLLSYETDFKKFHQGFLFVSNFGRQFKFVVVCILNLVLSEAIRETQTRRIGHLSYKLIIWIISVKIKK